MSDKEIRLQKKVKELEKKLEEQQLAKAAETTADPILPTATPTQMDDRDRQINELTAQVKLLADQVLTTQTLPGRDRPKYKPVPPDDYQEVGVTFSARRVFFVIGSYMNHKGIEVLPPYKLFKFQYAASDIRKDGMETEIVNSCTFTTHLKGEIEYLRDHPLYGIEFFENLNETMSADSMYREFRVRAAQQVVAMTDEAVINNAHQMGIDEVDRKSTKTLRHLVANLLGDQYVKEAKELDSETMRGRLLSQPKEH
jgi:hypothetical protein